MCSMNNKPIGKIAVIASDLDGTLLLRQEYGEDFIGERTRQQLIRAQQAGISLILASGRAYPKMLPFAKQLKMDHYGGWLVEINGTAVYDVKHGKRTVFHQLHRSAIHDLFTKLQAMEIEVIAYQDDSMYYQIPSRLIPLKQAYIRTHGLPKDHPLTAGGFSIVYDNRKGYPHQYPIKDASQLPETMNKICISDEPQRLHALHPLLDVYQEQIWWGYTTERWIEILPKGVNKRTGIEYCCQQMKTDLSHVLAFGDGENDIEMLKSCGFGIAMGNALDSVKRIAYDICDNNKNEGIADVIEHLLEPNGKEIFR